MFIKFYTNILFKKLKSTLLDLSKSFILLLKKINKYCFYFILMDKLLVLYSFLSLLKII